MTSYTETETYSDLLAKRKFAIAVVEAELADIRAHLGTVPRRRNGQDRDPVIEAKRKRVTNLTTKLKTRHGQLARVVDLRLPLWDLVHVIQDSDRTLWTSLQREKWHKELAAHEGRGEASLRDWYCLPTKAPSVNDIDLPEVGIEVKNIQGRRKDGKFQVQSIQSGAHGRQAYTQWMMEHAEAGDFKGLDPAIRQALAQGEVPKSVISSLPPGLQASLALIIRPSTIFARCEAIDCTTRNGFFHVIRDRFDDAFEAENVTKCSPKYQLREEYVLERLKATLVSFE